MFDIENFIEESLDDLALLVLYGISKGYKIIFPKSRDGKTRYSEQELKCIFLEKMYKETSFSYSNETPTKNVYRFANKTPLVSKELNSEGYRSANIDMSFYNREGILLNHIEFKYGQPEIFSIRKDLLKLICENAENNNYFVHYWVTDTYDKKTQKVLLNKFDKVIERIKKTRENKDFIQEKYEEQKNKVKIFLEFIVIDEKKTYTYLFNLDNLQRNISEIEPIIKDY